MTATTYFVIPIYNEAGNIGRVVSDIATRFPAGDWRVVVVDDGSQDESAAILAGLSTRFGDQVVVVTHEINRGVPAALSSGFGRAAQMAGDGDYLLCIEGDGTSNPALYEPIRAGLAAGNEIVIASRYIPGGGWVGFPWHRRLISRVGNWGLHRLFPYPHVTDFSIFYRGYRMSLVNKVLARWGARAFSGRFFSANTGFLFCCLFERPPVAEVAHFYVYNLKRSMTKFRLRQALYGYLPLIARISPWRLRQICLAERAVKFKN
ncbi:MAG: glycosyltransferase [Myxococcales bacterium]|nr:glycosyltransferase [Myxococcales bacterium]